MILAINYTDSKFEKQRKVNTETAYSKGKVDKVIEYSPQDLDYTFTEKHKKLFSYKRGGGLWIWKPYIILKALDELQEGDYLFYCDAGAYYVNKVQYLIDVLNETNQPIMGFRLPLLARQFTKKECYVLMNCLEQGENQILSGYLLFKKDDFCINFVKEWLKYASDERISSPKHLCPEIEEFDDFRAHREDQSIVSNLYYKYNLIPFRDPSQFGDRPWEYIWIPPFNWSKPWKYNPKNDDTERISRYPRIVVSCRKSDPFIYKIKEGFKSFFYKIGLYNESIYCKLYKARKE